MIECYCHTHTHTHSRHYGQCLGVSSLYTQNVCQFTLLLQLLLMLSNLISFALYTTNEIIHVQSQYIVAVAVKAHYERRH